MQQENKKVTYSFKNDYSEGAHPNILQALVASNLEQQDGYGEDQYCHAAIETIKEKLQDPNVDIHFVSGGTQANLIVISSILRPYESVIAADTGHISTHETGAIEATGHKVNTIDVKDGKLSPKKIKNLLDLHTDEHMVKPRMVYISNTTEVGTIYKKQELKDLHQFCRENDLLLFLDGARLGSALCSSENDLTLAEIAKLVDVFYIGGTKNGALIGEAIVISNEALKTNFRFNMKQKGALLAKGRLLGIQFLELFKEELFFQLGNHANQMALKLSENIIELGYQLLTPPQSNQIFPILPNKTIEKLKENYAFYVWSKIDEETSVIRLVTSWATKETAVEAFIEDLKKI